MDEPDAAGTVDIRDPVMEAGIAVVASPACENSLIPLSRHLAVVAIEHLDDVEAVAFHIAIVGEQLGKVDQHRRVLPAEEDAVAIGDRRIIDGSEIEREPAGGVIVRHEPIPPSR